ncbi:MAG: chromosomal replication initiator protein DnaA [Elusimicrobiales bacterium]|nr:chromosomal replication initiator protein DnaA [Elusimicrobiales bacterium]
MDNLTDIKEIWQEVLRKLATDVGSNDIDLWIRPVKAILIEGDTLKLEVPDAIYYDTVKRRYEEKIIHLLAEFTGRELKISYSMPVSPVEPLPQSKAAPASAALPANYYSFNPNYTFDSFIMGTSNRFAFASAESVAKSPGQANPFFIYSPPGLGKTHLLHAIAHGILKANPAARILYTASENFVNEYIDAVRGKADGAEAFRNKYRKLDCLLLDDIQFLLDKERSQEEFFYTFDSLFQSKKQIVLTSDRPPRELAMDDRIISRFLQGVVADIKIPDFETRVAILRQKRDQHAYDIPDDVITFIAENVKKNIRELEGCLITVGNFCSSMKMPPSIDTVKDIIKDYTNPLDHEEKKVPIELIKRVVAEKYNVEMRDFNSKKRTDNIAFPRQVAMYLACEMTDMVLKDIGSAFGKEHATVLHAKGKISHMVQTDPYFNEALNQIIAKIKAVNNQA